MTEKALKSLYVSLEKGKSPSSDARGERRQIYLTPEYLRGDGPPQMIPEQAGLILANDGDLLVLWDGDAGEFFRGKRGAIASTMVRINVARSQVRPNYLYHQLKYIERRLKSVGAGSVIRHVDGGFFKRVKIPIPKDCQQAAIADVLDTADALTESLRSCIAKIERLQMALMQQLLTGRLRPNGTLRGEREFWIHPKVGLVPNGWAVSPLKQLAEIQRGKFSHRPRNDPRFYGGPYPFIQTGDVSNSRGYIAAHLQTLSEEGIRISRRFPKGTIFISIVGVNVAATAIASYDVYAPDSVIGIIPNEDVVSEYLEFYLRSIQKKLAVLAGDSARENLNYGILKPLLVKYPSDPKEQTLIADILCSCESVVRMKEDKIVALRQLKKSLMQNLLTGRIRLPVDGASVTKELAQ
jgi:type I restriction enzyme S subunit